MASAVLFGLGCDGPTADYSKVNLIDVRGTVTLDEKPLAGAVISFDAPDGQFSYGLTNANGEYRLQFDSQTMGVTPGPKAVRISTARKILGLNATEESEGSGGEGASRTSASKPKELIPAKYHKKSELKVEVTPATTTHNFSLASN